MSALDIVLDLGPNPTGDVPCAVCGGQAPTDATFAAAVRNGPRVCRDCADTLAPAAVGSFTEALDTIDRVLLLAAPHLRPSLISTAMDVLTKLADDYDPATGPVPEPAHVARHLDTTGGDA